mmetsp:Transcript_23033/g.43560  ORF Transcript_23033/g.43560 Transcript_23033/m.43560 type:complete len:218 (+) Transcript_23033:978-1631(+)
MKSETVSFHEKWHSPLSTPHTHIMQKKLTNVIVSTRTNRPPQMQLVRKANQTMLMLLFSQFFRVNNLLNFLQFPILDFSLVVRVTKQFGNDAVGTDVRVAEVFGTASSTVSTSSIIVSTALTEILWTSARKISRRGRISSSTSSSATSTTTSAASTTTASISSAVIVVVVVVVVTFTSSSAIVIVSASSPATVVVFTSAAAASPVAIAWIVVVIVIV